MSARAPILPSDVVGTFVDAVYAIAITLLALELPREIEGPDSWGAFAGTIGEYVVAFAILLGFWIHHRRINSFIEVYDRSLLLVTGLGLMLACLLPTATALVFDYGADVDLAQLELSTFHGQGWSRAEFVDLFFVSVVVLADAALLVLARLGCQDLEDERVRAVRVRKAMTSSLLLAAAALSFLVPVPNRYFMLVIPLTLMFEDELGGFFRRALRR